MNVHFVNRRNIIHTDIQKAYQGGRAVLSDCGKIINVQAVQTVLTVS
jgi:hypothetical protein